METKNILALIDFSNLTEKVVDKAIELSKLYDAKCWLLHVAAPDPEFMGYSAGPQYIKDHRAQELKNEHETMGILKDKVEKQNVKCEALLVQGQINPTVLAKIEELDINLVIVGSHGRTKMYDLLVGSVCEYTLRHAVVPVLVIPDRGNS